ncbi:hypothetical protein F4808DRAFT_466880 [Astrocystis sublimbata]|nr:hypothetical protein F4808DRAFT_466880 [Astrocystis sublimbata]
MYVALSVHPRTVELTVIRGSRLYAGTKFRQNQKWVRPPKRLLYIDETQCLASGSPLDSYAPKHHFYVEDEYREEARSPSPTDAFPTSDDILGDRKLDRSPSATVSRKRTPVQDSSLPRPDLAENDTIPRSQNDRFRHGSGPQDLRTAQPSRLRLGLHAPPHGITHSTHFDDGAALPLKYRTEAILFRHYIQKVAVSLDCCDPYQHFELIIPERANTCHTLLNAILAIAARHLSHTTGFDQLASNRYHDACLKHLIPMMNHSSAIADENLFAATVILRMLEEMDGSLTGQDNYSHLLGIHAFVNAGDQYIVPGSLSAAAFWVGLRQEIYIAILTQQRVKLNLNECIVDRSLEPAADYTWSNRAVILLADVLNACFGDSPLTLHNWTILNDAVESWTRARPPSFNPFFYEPVTRSGSFPEIWHGSSCHIVGIQHHLLAQLFLVQFDPSIPRVGTTRRAAMREMTQRIETLMRKLCGLGISNQWTPPAMFTACIGIAMFGDHFSERSDQEALAAFLRKTETAHARPTAAIQEQLMKAWGWTGAND